MCFPSAIKSLVAQLASAFDCYETPQETQDAIERLVVQAHPREFAFAALVYGTLRPFCGRESMFVRFLQP